MSEQCPNCLSRRIGKNNYGKKTAGLVWAKQAGLDWQIQESPVRFATKPCFPSS